MRNRIGLLVQSLIVGIVLLVLGIVLYVCFYADCPAYLVYRSQQKYDDVMRALQLADEAGMAQSVGPLPDSYISELRALRNEMAKYPTPVCLADARTSLYKALDSGLDYYYNRSQESGNPADANRRANYESWRKDYLQKIRVVESCYPFCNLNIDPLQWLAPDL